MTTITRDRIQFEDYAAEIDDGNEQMHRNAAAAEWKAAATAYLERMGGGSAEVRLGHDHTLFRVTGNRDIADAADVVGWDAARAYVESEKSKIAH